MLFRSLKKYATEKDITFSSDQELVEKPEIYEFFMKETNRLTPHLASYEKIKKIIIIDRDFEIEAGEMTPTLKVRRKVVEEKYKPLIDRLYAD